MTERDAMTVRELMKTPGQIAAAGWDVVIPGELYHQVCNFFQRDLTTTKTSDERTAMLLNALVSYAKPVKPRIKNST